MSSRAEDDAVSGFALGLIVLMSLRPAIPRQVALQRYLPALHQPFVMVNPVAGTVNHHLSGLGNFQPELWGIFNRS
jgi:hypothetical protein